MAWITAEEALRQMGTKPQTLYANVSRGRIKAKPDPDDTRRSLYSADDVRRLAERKTGARKTEAIATRTIRWGDPILKSSISTVSDGRLLYRGKDAVTLSETMSFEDVAALLWEIKSGPLSLDTTAFALSAEPLKASFVALAERAITDLPSMGRALPALQIDAASVLATMVNAMIGSGHEHLAIHQRIAIAWDRPDAADIIRRALVLLADHELNASTFAARVTVSTGAALSAAVLSGFAALTGPLHGQASLAVADLLALAATRGAEQAIAAYLATGRPLPCFGHRLYPDGDVRAVALLASFDVPHPYLNIQAAGERLIGEAVNVDFALAAMATAFDLPHRAPFMLFATARTAGWLAHCLEQAITGTLIRPRAQYVGA